MESQFTVDRGKLRMERLRQLELEQLQWEKEALVMPEDLDRALSLSFASVKTEFSDLDGLSWARYPVPLVTNPWAVEEPTPKLTSSEIDDSPAPGDLGTPAHSPTFARHYSPAPLPYAPPSHADMTPFSPQDTIRVSRLTPSSRSPLQPANQSFSNPYGTSRRDPLVHGSGSPYALAHPHPSTSLALACHGLRHSACGHD